jgi:hypothetical protein
MKTHLDFMTAIALAKNAICDLEELADLLTSELGPDVEHAMEELDRIGADARELAEDARGIHRAIRDLVVEKFTAG